MAEEERISVKNWNPGLNLGINKGVHPVGGLWKVSNFHPRLSGLQIKSGYELAEQGIFPPFTEIPTPIASTFGEPVVSSKFEATDEVPLSSEFVVDTQNEVRGCHSRSIESGQKIEALLVVGNSFYQLIYDGTTWTINLITEFLYPVKATETIIFTEWNDKVYFAHAGKPLKYWDGTTIQDASPGAPQAGVVVSYEGFVVALDLEPDELIGESFPNGMRWTERFDDETWDDTLPTSATSGFKVPSQCPSRILAAVPVRDELVVLHEGEIETQRFISGDEILRTFVASTSVGILGKKAFATALDALMFAGNDNFYIYSQGTITAVDINKRIRDEVFTLPKENLATSVVYFDRGEGDLWWFIKTPTPKAYVFNINLNNWTIDDYDERFFFSFPACFIDPYPVEFGSYFVGEDASIYKFGRDVEQDEGLPINASAEFIIDFDTHKEKTISKIEIIADGTGSVTIGLDGMNNTTADPSYIERTLSLDPTLPNRKNTLDFPNINGKFIATRISTSAPIRISEIIYYVSIGGR